MRLQADAELLVLGIVIALFCISTMQLLCQGPATLHRPKLLPVTYVCDAMQLPFRFVSEEENTRLIHKNKELRHK